MLIKDMTPIDGPKKTIIRNDWLKEFPTYQKVKDCAIARRIGPIVISIGWDIVYKEYRPQSSVRNLTNEKPSTALVCWPKSRRNSLTWEQHEKGLYKEAVAELKEYSPIPLEGPLTLSQLLEAYDKEIKEPVFYTSRLDDPVLVTAWVGKEKLARKLALGYANYWKRNVDNYEEEKKLRIINLADTWHQDMLERISDREHLNVLIEESIVKYKLSKLPYEDLIIDF